MWPFRRYQTGESDNSHLLIANLATKHSSQYQQAFVKAVEEFKTRHPEEELVTLLQEQGVDANDGIDYNELLLLFGVLALLYRRSAVAAGQATARGISDELDEVLTFRLTKEMNEALKRQVAENLAMMVQTTEEAASRLVREMVEEGLSFEDAAHRWHQILGLTPQRVAQWQDLERGLLESGLISEEEIQQEIEKFAQAQLADRGKFAGGNETWQAMQQGRQFAFEAAVATGLFGLTARKIWWTMRDELVCPICAPMHGQSVPIGSMFVSPYNGREFMTAYAHVKCRCWTQWKL